MTRMKLAVMVLGLLAAAKAGTQEYLYRAGTKDVLVGAFLERAIQACQKDPRSPGLTASASIWTMPSDVRVVIGKTDLDVWIWQVDNALWSARYRNPYFYLVPAGRQSNIQCEYDIVNGIANVIRS